jgi:GR25 family glycosyltransferase involved in LPS biosynthesis
MNKLTIPGPVFRSIYRLVLWTRKFLGKKKCSAFNQVQNKSAPSSIERIYVINLDRQPQRLRQVKGELSQVLDALGNSLKNYVRRVSAVDALEFESSVETENVDQIYSLGDQLYVDPRRVLPNKLDFDEEIQMSRQEIAVALSHIKTWEMVASGEDQYALVLEDDICFSYRFSSYVEKVWAELCDLRGGSPLFDILYLSYKQVDQGAEKTRITKNVFQLFRGVWYLSGYVLSKRGAERLLNQLPVRGPVDLWINHKFIQIDALLASKSLIAQRIDEKSENSYSVLPVLSKIGILNTEAPSIFESMPLVKPVFVVGYDNAKLTSLGMALSMLGYRCCSDLDKLPNKERQSLFEKKNLINFDAYVNIGCIDERIHELAVLFPKGRLIVVTENLFREQISSCIENWSDRILVLSSQTISRWKPLCEFLKLVPPASVYPELQGLGQRRIKQQEDRKTSPHIRLKSDSSPWIIPSENECYELSSISASCDIKKWTNIKSDSFDHFDDMFWLIRDDTFPGNLALFSGSNLSITDHAPAKITVCHEEMKVRQFSSAAITTIKSFLYGRFEAVLKPPKVDGLITGMFLHRNSPRQEIDIEFLGKDPCKMLINVYYNPGCDGARFDYGYRGTPVLVELGFDATSDFHSYAIEWEPGELRWHVDGVLVHRRSNWEPTPIPHLPMKFHINIWPSMSRELAGKIDLKLLPATAQIQSVRLATTTQKCCIDQSNMFDSEDEEILQL